MTSFDSSLEQALRGRLAGNALAVIVDVLDALERRVDARVMSVLRDGKGLTDEQAKQAWYEKFSLVQLRERLEQLARAGATAGKRITPDMEMKHGA